MSHFAQVLTTSRPGSARLYLASSAIGHLPGRRRGTFTCITGC